MNGPVEHEQHVPGWAKWALGISQAMILVLLAALVGWMGPAVWSTFKSVNVNTYKLDQVQKANSAIPIMQTDILHLQDKQADILQVQADHDVRLQKLESQHGARVPGWTH